MCKIGKIMHPVGTSAPYNLQNLIKKSNLFMNFAYFISRWSSASFFCSGSTPASMTVAEDE